MNFETEQEIAKELRTYISENMPLTNLSDEE